MFFCVKRLFWSEATHDNFGDYLWITLNTRKGSIDTCLARFKLPAPFGEPLLQRLLVASGEAVTAVH